MKNNVNRRAFTLIELLLSMALLAILIMVFIGNFNTSLKRGRDAQRKNDISSLQKALEVYYEDNGHYPTFDIISGNPQNKFCTSQLCNMGTLDTVYMTKIPKDPSASYSYKYEYVPAAAGEYEHYYLYSYIENGLDQGSGVSQKGFDNHASCTAGTSVADSCKYFVGSSNAVPLTPIP